MGEPMGLVERVAREFIDRDGSDALPVLREHAEIADGLRDGMAAKAWRDIADAVERLFDSIDRDGLSTGREVGRDRAGFLRP
jgi:hypothetical protein